MSNKIQRDVCSGTSCSPLRLTRSSPATAGERQRCTRGQNREPESGGGKVDKPIRPSVRPEKSPPMMTRNAEKRSLNTNSVYKAN